ncbi:MAG: DUF5618 family protein [Fibromonadales bacterium]|nr:DUF5618 family protein [Fibromonadales bacterium]
MTLQDQQNLKQKSYAEAMRYLANAKDYLKTAGKDERDESYYKDKKYVRTACGTAYNGVFVALDALLEIKGIDLPKKKTRRTIDFYRAAINKDRKLLNAFNSVYNTLHLSGYYDGETRIKTIQSGFEAAIEVIDKIKPAEAA